VGGLGLLLYLGVLGLIMYFLMVRPQRRNAAAHRDLVSSISVGDEVVTAGGMRGKVVGVDDEEVDIEIAPGIHAAFLKSYVIKRMYDDKELESGGQEEAESA
jgi:preprotein translocase subunit YajC